MDKRKEGKPGEARAALRRSVRENGCVSALMLAVYIFYCSMISFMYLPLPFPSFIFVLMVYSL